MYGPYGFSVNYSFFFLIFLLCHIGLYNWAEGENYAYVSLISYLYRSFNQKTAEKRFTWKMHTFHCGHYFEPAPWNIPATQPVTTIKQATEVRYMCMPSIHQLSESKCKCVNRQRPKEWECVKEEAMHSRVPQIQSGLQKIPAGLSSSRTSLTSHPLSYVSVTLSSC